MRKTSAGDSPGLDSPARDRSRAGCKDDHRGCDQSHRRGRSDVDHVFGCGGDGELRPESNDLVWPLFDVRQRLHTHDRLRATCLTRHRRHHASGSSRRSAPTAGPLDQSITAATPAWAQQMQIWLTPWGFLRGAAANAATVRSRKIEGETYRVVTWSPPQKAPSGQPYKSSAISMARTSSNVSRHGWSTRSSATCTSSSGTATIGTSAGSRCQHESPRDKSAWRRSLRRSTRPSPIHQTSTVVDGSRQQWNCTGRWPWRAGPASRQRRWRQKNSPTASFESLADTLRSPWNSRITSSCSKGDRTKLAAWRF